MKESECPDLELCKQIGYLFPESEWWWRINQHGEEIVRISAKVEGEGGFIPAPTVCEMLERLPAFTIKAGTNKKDGYIIERDSYSKRFHDKSIANALAKMLIHLDKEGLL